MPTDLPTTPDTMNYAIVFLAAILVAALIWWFVRGRNFYTGPIVAVSMDGDGVVQGVIPRERGSSENGVGVREKEGNVEWE